MTDPTRRGFFRRVAGAAAAIAAAPIVGKLAAAPAEGYADAITSAALDLAPVASLLTGQTYDQVLDRLESAIAGNARSLRMLGFQLDPDEHARFARLDDRGRYEAVATHLRRTAAMRQQIEGLRPPARAVAADHDDLAAAFDRAFENA